MTTMRVTVKLFAILRDRAGVSALELELPAGATVASASEMLVAKLPAVREHLRNVAFAVNRSYTPATTPLNDGDELAIIPPVTGG